MNERVREITNAVDDCLNRITHWCEDDGGPGVMPDTVVLSIEHAALTASSGDIPQCCQELVMACSQLQVESQRYANQEHGAWRPENGSPGPQFWNAVKKVTEKRRGAEMPMYDILEPVCVLRKQGVDDTQIAVHIYGNGRGEGPFMRKNGQIDYVKLNQEAEKPGSVLGENWVPPWKMRQVEERKKGLATQLLAFDHLETGQHYEDPGTVESMLMDGCYIQQIMAGKNVSRSEVLRAAEEIGIPAVDRPGIEINDDGDDQNDMIDESEKKGTKQRTLKAKNKMQADGVREAAIEAWEASGRTLGAPEVAKQLKKAGMDCTASRAGQLIQEHQRRERETLAATGGPIN